MKKISTLLSVIVVIALVFTLTSCTPFDKSYGESEENKSSYKYKNIKVPDIKSDDEVMPTFFDISLYDEENYSQIYLGKDFEFKITYAGSEFTVPSSLSDMEKKGWKLLESDKYNDETLVMAGKSIKASFVNDYGKQITAKFFNPDNSSKKLSKCDIVKFAVAENLYLKEGSVYGQFFVNGVSNESAITDVIEYLGAPSHFYAVNENEYYLDYFISKKDKRNGITVYIDVAADSVTAIEFSMYD